MKRISHFNDKPGYFLQNRNIFVYCMITILIFMGSCEYGKNGYSNLSVHQNWEFKNIDDSTWLPAKVPGTVHTDLLKNDIIGEPFYRNNEKKQQWIEKETWQYRTTFEVPDHILKKENIRLIFEGLDTYAEVRLNGTKILDADNMFRTWITDIKNLLQKKNNRLEITFLPAVKMDSLKATRVHYDLPQIRGFSRKAPYQYGWDWGPRFVSCGIWRPVNIEAWNGPAIDNVLIIQKNIQEKQAQFIFDVNFISQKKPGAYRNNLSLKLQISFEGNSVFEKEAQFQPGVNRTSIPARIPNPQRWWCNGMGDPNLYNYSVSLLRDGHVLQKKAGKFGIRTVELVREKDPIGESFYFRLNGKPVFMKGANYIPQDNFLPSVPAEKYQKLIDHAVAANMNMLRVWGGGIYENDLFYDLCDEKGILVWQDFMFACNMYPGDSAFLENVRQEARDNIIRLRNHPCIALWCGNNEVNEAWHNWGWQDQLEYSHSDSAEIWNNYQKLFHGLLPEIINQLDMERPYHPSSPTIGWGHEESRRIGDSHYWGVWWGEEPFDIYRERVGRFMSEYGFQGMPPLESIEKFTVVADRKLGSEVMEVHQKHPRGTELIDTYMKRDYRIPESFGRYIYVSQLLQAEGIKTAIEAHRRNMPRCMGTLYWQLNDCWPVTSWSSVDYYGNWKALHYFVKDAYSEVLVSPVIEEEKVKIHVISDRQDSFNASLAFKITRFNGEVLRGKTINFNINGPQSFVAFKTELSSLIRGFNKEDIVLLAEIREKNTPLSRNLLYFEKPKNLNLPSGKPKIAVEESPNGYLIRVTSKSLIKNIAFSHSKIDGHFDKNFFDIPPRDTVEVQFLTNSKATDLKTGLNVQWLNR